MASESIAREASWAIDSEPIRARGIIVKEPIKLMGYCLHRPNMVSNSLPWRFDKVESCWIEIRREKLKKIVIECINRHPWNDREHFLESPKQRLDKLNNKGKELFIVDDINIDFLKYNNDNQTSEYFDMLINCGFLPLITKPKRVTDHSSTIIDHIYSNVFRKVINAGICLADVFGPSTNILYSRKWAACVKQSKIFPRCFSFWQWFIFKRCRGYRVLWPSKWWR